MMIPPDYVERVYAGLLGKIIGVYLGRPFEGWTYEKIMEKLGEIHYYVNDKLGLPLIVTDDDIAGTFTFLRALPDYGDRLDISPQQIGQTWINYLIEKRTVLWWGGLGNSTEHTAYLRLKRGIPAPLSGSMQLNGKVVSEQIGAQIFIDGWAMVSPGDPQQAADLARRAASVSHDGEAIYGAQVLAAMEALAFVEPDIHCLMDTAVSLIPRDSVIYRLIADLRDWRTKEPDWRKTRLKIVERYGYDRYGGNCHMVPNHALIQLGLLYGEDNFQKSLLIANTSGWDTDCNSGNLGCLMGIKNGLAGIDAGPDWRGPVADRLYLSTADGGRCITDAVRETYHIASSGYALAGQASLAPKAGARFHFELPGSVQGFRVEDAGDLTGAVTLENVAGHSQTGSRSLAIRCRPLPSAGVARVATPTFILPGDLKMPGYALYASPTLYPGQAIRAGLQAGENNTTELECRLFVSHYAAGDILETVYGPELKLHPGETLEPAWTLPDFGGYPIARVGLEVAPDPSVESILYLDYLTWDGVPDVELKRPEGAGSMWSKAWVQGVDYFQSWAEPYRLVQDEGTGLLIQGCREWKDYQVSADVTPHMVKSAGLAARVQGMRRYYALLLCDEGRARLVKALDGTKILAESEFPLQLGRTYQLSLQVKGRQIRAFIDDQVVFDHLDEEQPLHEGAIALVCEEGRTATTSVRISPLK
ncbi:MAG: ADP-ribosylglycohydrolase family protein [Omnitrophica WOR_2 bacterium]